jgi:uncharacterized membrane-anchored protein
VISRRTLGAWGGLALVLGAVNVSVARKEWLRARGQPLLLELAPRDPRSLLEGDYLRLDYRVERELVAIEPSTASGTLVVAVDGRGVASFLRLASPSERLAPTERRLRFRQRAGSLRIGPDAFFFQEGQGDHFAGARFAEVRADGEGNVLLVGLRDRDLVPL